MSTSYGATAPSLPRVAVRLRLALLRGALRPGPGAMARRIGLALGAFFGGVLALAAFGVLTVSRGDGRLPVDLATLVYTGLLIGWVVLPIMTFGSDDLLDPTRLALLPLTRRQLMTLLGIGGLVGVAPIASGVAALGLVPAAVHSVTSLLVAVAAAALEVTMCVVTSRATAAALSGLLRSRRGRDLGAFLAALVVVSVQLINPGVQVVARHGTPQGNGFFENVTAPLRWTPPGLLATAPGRPLGVAILSLLAVVAFIGMVAWVWERSVRHSLERPDRSGGGRRRGSELTPRALRPFLSAGRVGAIAAKDLRYLTREPRRMVALLTSVLIPGAVLAFAPISTGHRPPPAIVFGVCGVAVLNGLSGANRFGMDGTATWMLLASATDRKDARRDLLGGDVAAAVTGLTLVITVGVVMAVISGSARHLPAALGLSFGLLGTVIGASGLVSVLAPYAVPESRNAFSTGSAGQGMAAGMLTLVAMGVCTALCLPLLGLAIASVFVPALGFLLLVVGAPYGFGLGAVIRRMAVRRWVQHGPEILQVIAEARP
jgi:ABC-2 type transport system permease protein